MSSNTAMEEDGGNISESSSSFGDLMDAIRDNGMEEDVVLSSIDKDKAGPSSTFSKDKAFPMEIEEEDDDEDLEDLDDVPFTEAVLNKFCKEASRSFFSEYGLISHQINSYNDFVDNGIQALVDSIGEINVEPGYDPSKKGGGESGWRRARIKFGKVKITKPMFWTGDKAVCGNKELKFLPRHARLQKMTYSARMKVEVEYEVYTMENERSDKFKTGQEQRIVEKILRPKEKTEVLLGSLPVMVRSNLCWMNGAEKGDCDFDHGGYFLIKGAEKVIYVICVYLTTCLFIL
ncbi:Dna-directed rna polymerase subunit beta [Thalictrum thalictroides]|uniref:DNA-directed RNA polymerase n=1 Tax=Thalictrum thalictroides TaxID=46969 RepID=A0A7J6VSS9_THATH|nr:Dna-directed rna polymerase subunit beta [Thalictrum thalictroides]